MSRWKMKKVWKVRKWNSERVSKWERDREWESERVKKMREWESEKVREWVREWEIVVWVLDSEIVRG